jgi:hypothetical protein
MVNLFFEIRRNLPHVQRADMKIADARIGNLMVDLYKSTKDENVRVLIEAFLDHAGSEWSEKIKEKSKNSWAKRVDNVLPAQPTAHKINSKDANADNKKRYYRGARVD